MSSIITGTGSYIPEEIQSNAFFLENEFYDEGRLPLEDSNDLIIEKFKNITGIEERRYLPSNLNNSDIAAIAAQRAIKRAERECIDHVLQLCNNDYSETSKMLNISLSSLYRKLRESE